MSDTLKHAAITEKIIAVPIGARQADFIVEGKILVVLNATAVLEDVHWAQGIDDLRAFRFAVGLRLDFGSKSQTLKNPWPFVIQTRPLPNNANTCTRRDQG